MKFGSGAGVWPTAVDADCTGIRFSALRIYPACFSFTDVFRGQTQLVSVAPSCVLETDVHLDLQSRVVGADMARVQSSSPQFTHSDDGVHISCVLLHHGKAQKRKVMVTFLYVCRSFKDGCKATENQSKAGHCGLTSFHRFSLLLANVLHRKRVTCFLFGVPGPTMHQATFWAAAQVHVCSDYKI